MPKPRNEDQRRSFFTALLCCCSVLDLLNSGTAQTVNAVPKSPVYENADSLHWCEDDNSVYFVDRTGGTVNRYSDDSGIFYTASIIGFTELAFIVPVAHSRDMYVIGDGFNVGTITWDGITKDSLAINGAIIVGDGRDNIASGKADISGRLYVSMKQGGLYLISEYKVVTEMVAQQGGIFKEIAWDLTNTTLYRAAYFSIVQYAVDPTTGVVNSTSTEFFNFMDQPDKDHVGGLSVMDDGNLLAVTTDSSYAVYIDARNKTLIDEVNLNHVIVSSMAFGSTDMITLFVATIKNAAFPKSGTLFKVSGTGKKGIAGVSAVINV